MPNRAAPRKPAKRPARQARPGFGPARGTQVKVVFAPDTQRWLEQHAGGKRAVAGYVRAVIEREREAAREAELLEMFNRAAEELTQEDRDDWRLFMQAHPNRD